MSYRNVAVRHHPIGLWMLDYVDPFSDYSGFEATGSFTGTPSLHFSLINGQAYARVFTNTITASYSSQVFKAGKEKQPFSLAAWARVINPDTEQVVLGHTAEMDGILIDGNFIKFRIKYANGYILEASHYTTVPEKVFVVGTYTPGGIVLYVNGELVDSADVPEELDVVAFTSSADLATGATTSSQQVAVAGVGIYAKALNSDQILEQYLEGAKSASKEEVAGAFGGEVVSFAKQEVALVAEKTYITDDDWQTGQSNNVTIKDNTLAPQSISGTSLAGTWHGQINLASGVSPAASTLMLWEGRDATVECSTDGITWHLVTRGQNIDIVSDGANVSAITLFVRVTFAGSVVDDPAFIKNLDIYSINVFNKRTPELRQYIYTSPAHIKEDGHASRLSDDTGVKFESPGGHYVYPSSAPSTPVTKTYEIFVRSDIDNLSSNFPSTATYSNAVLGDDTPVGEWRLIHIVSDTGLDGDFFAVGDFQLAHSVIYPRELTAQETEEIYVAYSGVKVWTIDDDSAITITKPVDASQNYAHDWTIQTSD